MARVEVKTQVLEWAIDRSGKDRKTLAKQFGKLTDWRARLSQL